MDIQIRKPMPTPEEIEAFRKRQQFIRQSIEDKKVGKRILEPSAVKSIFRIRPNEELEEYYIHQFLEFPNADPTQYTMAMEGKPFVARVGMENGFAYQIAMTKLIYIKWPGGVSDRLSPPQHINHINPDHPTAIVDPKFISDKTPIIIADSIYYGVVTNPIHDDGKVYKRDSLETRWREDFQIARGNFNSKEIGGYALAHGAFECLNSNWDFAVDYPPHLLAMFGKVQKEYERAQKLIGFGKSIYTIMDASGKIRGHGYVIPNYEKEGFNALYIPFDVPDIKFINPNQPLKLIAKQSPKRYIVPKPQKTL